MRFFHGSREKDLQIKWGGDRCYSFPYFFMTSEIELAKNYSKHYARTDRNLFFCDFDIRFHEVDFGGMTYTSEFRNLIFKLSNEDHKAVLLKNCLDKPSEKWSFVLSDILVVFDLDIINLRKHI